MSSSSSATATAGAMFTADWMAALAAQWNGDASVKDALAKIDFTSTIGYGMKGERHARGVLVVEHGVVVRSGEFAGETLQWDLRADEKHWQKWTRDPPSMAGLAAAFFVNDLKMATGDYAAMMRNSAMATPFVAHFKLFGRIAAQQANAAAAAAAAAASSA